MLRNQAPAAGPGRTGPPALRMSAVPLIDQHSRGGCARRRPHHGRAAAAVQAAARGVHGRAHEAVGRDDLVQRHRVRPEVRLARLHDHLREARPRWGGARPTLPYPSLITRQRCQQPADPARAVNAPARSPVARRAV